MFSVNRKAMVDTKSVQYSKQVRREGIELFVAMLPILTWTDKFRDPKLSPTWFPCEVLSLKRKLLNKQKQFYFTRADLMLATLSASRLMSHSFHL